MSSALVTMSHTPLMGFTEPAPGVRDRVREAIASAREFVTRFDPELVVMLAPDHYNGVFYDMMPPFCVGAAAESIGDYDTTAGHLTVDEDAALVLARAALADDLDVTVSYRLYVDHGFAQPLDLLFGGLDRVPVVPVFMNCVAEPLGPVRRARLLGDALGRAAAGLGRRVLFLGSGGLSHDPPVPRLADATPEVAARLISEGRHLTPEARAERQRRVIGAGRDFAAGTSTMQELNPEWDRQILDVLASGQLEVVDGWTTEWFTEQAGHSAHETRTSIAAYAAVATAGPYEVTSSFYEAIPEWIAGYAVTTALPV
ncbi:MAG TPA: 3-carboxyethylcatechol 2,3-dioxygenase [Pseudonocardia sp.]|jgi:2,3-dihydroxyphenylpropionate 1,2-dioxygenase|nr:3-carboxyethylcatechol 2,3-dioxygenase [Pseudonocardia sp.]